MDRGFPIAFIAIALVVISGASRRNAPTNKAEDTGLKEPEEADELRKVNAFKNLNKARFSHPNNNAVRLSFEEQKTQLNQHLRQLSPKWFFGGKPKPKPNPKPNPKPVKLGDIGPQRPVTITKVQENLINAKAKLKAVQALRNKNVIKGGAQDMMQTCKSHSALGFGGTVLGLGFEAAVGVGLEKAYDKITSKPSCAVQDKSLYKIENILKVLNDSTACKQKCIDIINEKDGYSCVGFTFNKKERVCTLFKQEGYSDDNSKSGFCEEG